MSELQSMEKLLSAALTSKFRYSEQKSDIIANVYLRHGRIGGEIGRIADLSGYREELVVTDFLDDFVAQNRTRHEPSKYVKELTVRAATVPLRKVEAPPAQKPHVIAQKQVHKLTDDDIRVAPSKKPEQTIVKAPTLATKPIKKDIFPLKRKAAKVITSKDSYVIDLCNRFDIGQLQAEKAIESYKNRFNGIHDMEEIADISGGKASAIYNYLPTIGMKRNPLTVEEPRRKLKSKVH
ncbi:MAG TPA: hypothetical protein VMV00_00330 [Candidatus Baltobacteraceae bacterium]|nr:hypothetical protein [Candidatus Baltobacteraceae bacterium]